MFINTPNKPGRIQSAPSTVGPVDKNREEKKSYQIQRQSSFGELITKVLARKISEDSVKTRKGFRFRPPFKNLRVGDNVNFKKDCSEEPVETTKAGSRISVLVSTPTGSYSVDENESPKNLRRPWFKGRKSKVSIGECVEESVEVEPKTGLPELKCSAVNPNENAESHTKNTTASNEKTKSFVTKRENPEESVKLKQVEPNLMLAEESNAQTKFHSIVENTETYFEDSLNPLSTVGLSAREEKRTLRNYPKSKIISIYERDLETESKSSVQYFYFNAKHFQHFHYIYNLMRDCHERIESLRRTNDRRNCMAENVIIKIGIAGEFTEDKLDLISKRRGRREMPTQNQQIWGESPILCFQKSTKSALKMLCKEKACHKILIIPYPNQNEHERVEDSIIIIREDKEQILRTISVCLEKQIRHILQDWLANLSVEGFGKHLPGIVDEIEDIRREMFDENSYHITGASAFRGASNEPNVPGNVIKYLFRRPDVNSFGIWRNSSFKVFVKKTINVDDLEHELKELNHAFFKKYNLEVVKGELVQLNTLKQGDSLVPNPPTKDGTYYEGTLGGFVTKTDDERKIYAVTCSHLFEKENQLAYTVNPVEGSIGKCVFTCTTKEQFYDFAAIEIVGSLSSKCDVALRREDKKKISAKVYNESLECINFVHKIGAETNVTKGRILSSEYYNKALPKNTFLVKGTGKNFSEQGDSGSLVFSRPRTGRQNFINVFGMVFANNFTLREDDNNSDNGQNLEKNKDSEGTQNRDAEKVEANVDKTTSSNAPASSVGDDDKNAEILSCCYRIHPAFDLFKEERGVEVKFKDDLPTPTSSPDDSYEETN